MEKPDDDNIDYKLSQLLDGDLSPDEEAALLARLQDDDELARTYAGYRRLDEMLEDLTVAPELADVDYDAQRGDIMAMLEKKALLARPRVRTLPWVFGGAMAAAAAVLLVVGAVMFFKTSVVDPGTVGPRMNEAVVSVIVPPQNLGTVESAVEPLVYDTIAAVSIVQIRVNYLDDDEFSLSDPDDNPLAHTAGIDRNDPKQQHKPLPAGTVLMVFDRPVERDVYDGFDIF